MKTIIAGFILALVLAPLATFIDLHTWSGQYAHWQLPESRAEAILVAWNADPPPQKPQPADSNWCRGFPIGWPGCPNTGVASW